MSQLDYKAILRVSYTKEHATNILYTIFKLVICETAAFEPAISESLVENPTLSTTETVRV